jgi:carboxyl-terminal processing protease
MQIRSKRLKICLIVISTWLVFSAGLSTYSAARADSLSDTVPPEVSFLVELQDFLKNNYVKEVKDLTLLKGAIKGMVESLEDPYSEYYTPDSFKDFNESASGNFGGIGIVLTSREKTITILSVLEGTPAELAGLKPGDKIIEVDGINIKGMSTAEAASKIKGDKGTNVSLGIVRDGDNSMLKFEITRDTIRINPIESKILGQGIGYLKIAEFNENTVENLDKALNNFKYGGVVGVVLDLRNNPGGFLDQAVDVASRFVPEGPVVHLVSKDGKVKAFLSKSQPYPFKLVVLVNGGTASAAEIVAGAIKDREAGKLIGEKTFGKATVQSTLNLGVLGGVKLTVARYTTPNGTDINKTGIVPNVEVEFNRVDFLKDLLPLKGERELKYGYVGLDVIALQQRLKVLNIFNAVPDGVYGPRTQQAVRVFQGRRGLPSNGIADAFFYKALNEAIQEHINSKEDTQLRKAIDILKEQMKNPKAV